jgi:hypothetical protein
MPLDGNAARAEVLDRLKRLVTIDAAFFATVDPVTLLFTSALADEPLGPLPGDIQPSSSSRPRRLRWPRCCSTPTR